MRSPTRHMYDLLKFRVRIRGKKIAKGWVRFIVHMLELNYVIDIRFVMICI